MDLISATRVESQTNKDTSDKLDLSNAQSLRRKKKTIAVLRQVHCASTTNKANVQPIIAGLWTTLIGSAQKPDLQRLISTSNTCSQHILPKIVQNKVKRYETSKANQVRSVRVLLIYILLLYY